MLDREQAAKLTAKILSWSDYPECSVSINESEVAQVRFARSGITTSGLSLRRTITISSTREGRTGRGARRGDGRRFAESGREAE